MNTVFRQIKKDLRDGLIVLFSGTPCQTSGLNSYVGKRLRTNLFLIDIVCHGVPGPYLWRDYLAYLEKKQGSPICWVNFRDKQKFGWAAHYETFKFVKGGRMSFTFLFYKHIMLRKSCGKCHFTNLNRPSDITIADFWGWKKTDPNINSDDKGVSLVLINTEKGRKLFEMVQSRMIVITAELDNCIQPNMIHPTRMDSHRDDFEKDYVNHGFEYVFRKYGEDGWRYKLEKSKQQFIVKVKSIAKFLLRRK